MKINEETTRVGLTNGTVKEKLDRKLQMASREFDNGFTNGAGRGAEQGLVNGAGQGGFTNGLASESFFENKNNENPFYKPNKKRMFVGRLFAISLVFMLIFSAVYFTTHMNNDSTIDGNFDEWDNSIDLSFARMDITKTDNNKMQIHLNKQGMFKGDGEKADCYLIFINDKTSTNGFLLGYDTYEYYIEFYGTNRTLEGVKGYQFDENRENYDWNGFNSRYSSFSLNRAWDLNNIEIELRSVQLGRTNLTNIDLLVYHFYPNTNFEYSQVVSVDECVNSGEHVSGTRNHHSNYFIQDFVNNTLEVNIEDSLAYSYIPYDVKIIKEPVVVEQTNQTVSSSPNYTPITQNNVYTNLTIVYENGLNDTIKQCGGTVIDKTIEFVTINDSGFFIERMKNIVEKCIFDGYFGYQEVYKEFGGTRGNLKIPDLPQPLSNGTITDMNAMGYDHTEMDITIDGALTEYSWGRVPPDEYLVDLTYDMKIWTMRNNTHLFVGVLYITDTTDSTTDRCNIYFDTDHDATASPDADDKRIQIEGTGTITYYEGNGASWSSTTRPTGWNAGDGVTTTGTYGARRSYEFVVPISDLNDNWNFDNTTDEIGFGVKCYMYINNPAQYHTWYPDANYNGATPTTEYMNTPSNWADLIRQMDYPDYKYFDDMDVIGQTTSATITLDGNLDESAWDTDAYHWCMTDAGKTNCLYTMQDDTYLYIGYICGDYTTLGVDDLFQVSFDCDDDRTTPLDLNDKVIQIDDANVTIYGEDQNQDGNWEAQTTPTGWVGYNGATDGNITWEVRVTLSELNETGNYWQVNDTIGFGTACHHTGDTQKYYSYFPCSLQEDFILVNNWNKPDSWGQIYFIAIPEGDFVYMSIIMFGVACIMFNRRKRGGEDEDN